MTSQRGAWAMRGGESKLPALGLLTACTLFAGCHQNVPTADEAAPPAKPVVKTADRGPVKLVVTADRDRISIAERLNLTIEVQAAEGIEVEMPQFGAQMNDFQIRDFREPPLDDLGDGVRRYLQVYDLDIFLSGEYNVPAITARYRDRRGASTAMEDDAQEKPAAELTTEPFTIEVTSLLEGEFDPTSFRDVKEVVELPADRTWAWVAWVGGAVGFVVLCVVLVLIVRWRSRRSERMIVIPPHEWAFRQLRELADAKLIEAGRVRDFYYRLSEITRTYIELRFALLAPERTTEEFLEEMRVGNALPLEHQAPLAEFL